MYATLEQRTHGRAWTHEEIALGFVGDVGDLVKLVMAQEGVRQIPDAQSRLAHELADCLWSVLVLAGVYGIDLEEAFLHTMDNLERQITTQ
jgi:NTP pyrophosphatase (non-canonical NTP hydrolase)